MIWALLLLAGDPQPRVQVEIAPNNGVLTGQRVALAITLSTPDLFAGAPSFDMPAIPGCVVLPPAGSPVIGSATVDGTSFTTQRHEFAIYSERAGSITMPPFPIRFESNAGFGKPIILRSVVTKSVSFTAKTPPGADGLGLVIAARGLKIRETWTPEPHAAKVGDAFTRTVAIEADDVPGMVLPPLKLDAVEGLKAYPKPPTIADHTERGQLTGLRTETATYVCDRAGTVSIPARTLTWWDLDASELHSAKLRGVQFDVSGSEIPAAQAPAPAGPGRHWVLPVATAILASLCAIGWWTIRESIADWIARSERMAFVRFTIACLFGRKERIVHELTRWLTHHAFEGIEEFAEESASPRLANLLCGLQRAIFGMDGFRAIRVDRIALLVEVRRMRRQLRLRHSRSRIPIPELND